MKLSPLSTRIGRDRHLPNLQVPARQRLKPPSRCPRPVRVRLSMGPLQRLAWAFGFRF